MSDELRYENVLRRITGEGRGGAEGYAEADAWRSDVRAGKIGKTDMGIVIALEKLLERIESLERRIEELESK